MKRERVQAAAGAGRRALAAVLMALAPLSGRAALVTRWAPAAAPKPYAAVPAILRDLPEADPCATADEAVYALESSIVESQAQSWAYLMKRPGFSVESLGLKPGAGISHADLQDAFYKRLASWYALEQVPEPSDEQVRNANDVTMRIRLVLDMCR